MGCNNSKAADAYAADASRPAPIAHAPSVVAIDVDAGPSSAGPARPFVSRGQLEDMEAGDVSRDVSSTADLPVSFAYTECGVCYENLYMAHVSVMVDGDGKRVCRHFAHTKCCVTLEKSHFGKKCPICQEPFERAIEVPDPEVDAPGWFHVVDMDGTDELHQWEVVDALCATVNVDSTKLQRNIGKLWSTWDKTNSNTITMQELTDPEEGLLSWVKQHMSELQRRGPAPIPDIKARREDWFKYWDNPRHGGDGTGQLTKDETARALMKTFRSQDVLLIRNIVSALWDDFDVDKSGTIKPHEFLRPSIGLLDTILANTQTMDNMVSQSATECALCFVELHEQHVAGLVDAKGRRSCPHYFHSECMRLALEDGRCQWACVKCKCSFTAMLDIPDPLKNPEGWFHAVDVDHTKQLNRWEVVDALNATMPIDAEKLDSELQGLWETWDKTESNTITLAEFMNPNGGLLSWVRDHRSQVQRRRPAPIPDIKSQREEWFRYWDNPANGGDGTGQLTKAETVRALRKTFKQCDMNAISGLVDAMWDDFDVDKSGTIKPHEFLRPQVGLLDTILANM